MKRFIMNGILWRVQDVDPSSPLLIDRTGAHTVATTDPRRNTVFMSSELTGGFRRQVLIHELGHCMLVSYDLVDDIARMVKPEARVYAEEFICNLFANYGMIVFRVAEDVLGEDAIHVVPYELDRIIA